MTDRHSARGRRRAPGRAPSRKKVHRPSVGRAGGRSAGGFQEAQRLAHIGSWRWEAATDTVTWSEELYRINARDPAAPPPTYREMASCYTPESWQRLQAAVARALEHGDPYELDLDLVRPDGSIRMTIASGEASRDAGGRIVGLHGTVQDVTERKRAEEALRRSEAMLRKAQAQGRMGSWTWNIATGMLEWSDEMFRLFGLSKEGFSGSLEDVVATAIHPADRGKVNEVNRRVIEESRPTPLEYRVVWPDGSEHVIWAEAGELVLDESQRPVLITGFAQDITERRRTEAIAARALSLLESTMESTADGILVSDGKGRMIRSNGRFRELWGIPDEIIASADDDAALRFVLNQLVEPDAFLDGVRQLYATPEAVSFDTLAFKDGRVIERYSRPQSVDGEVVGRVWSFRDVTERVRAETALRESEERYRSLVELSPEAVVVHRGGRISYANRAAGRMIGLNDPAELVGREIGEFVQPDAREWLDGRIRSVQELGESVPPRELVLRRPDGSLLTVETAAVPIALAGQTASLSVMRDITDRKLAEQERGRLEEQLLRAHRLESVGRLAGGVAHDFNNMLGVILGHAEFALEQTDPAQPLHTDLLEIRNAATRSAALVRQLLAFARRQTVAPRAVILNDVVSDTIQMLGRLIGEEIELRWRPGPALWHVSVDPTQVDQILTNLCVNARDAIAGVGTITIETANVRLDRNDVSDLASLTPGEYVRLSVADTGCGMDRATQEQIFEPFFTTKGVGEGTGLGLSTVYGAVQQSHGAIKVASAPGAGATFTIYLPRHLDAPAAAGEGTTPSTPAAGQETILLVEDEPTVLRLTRSMLQRQGYTVLDASRPSEALRLAAEHGGPIHLLMTDVVMPEMNGRRLATEILAVRPGLKCVFMSGYPAEAVSHRGALDQGVAFLQKPFSMASLSAKIREALDRPR